MGLLVLAGYVIIGKAGLQLAYANPSATPVWPATGFALAVMLLFGRRIWPVVFAGAFIVNITTAGTVVTSLGIATGNTLEAIVGAWLLQRFAGGRDCFLRAERIFLFVLLGALFSTTLSATFGTLSLHFGGFLPDADWSGVWLTWWLGDASGALLVTPLLLSWAAGSPTPRDRAWYIEAGIVFALLILVASVLFTGLSGFMPSGTPRAFFCVPFLIWAAVRLGIREAATATVLLAGIAVWGTLEGKGVFILDTPNSSLLLLQAYMAVAAIMTLILAAAVAERKVAEERLRELAISDPLTGIANYRHLITRLEGEVERSGRTDRPFAVIFMDVDGLKAINDRLGHIVGSRALCRVAEVLKASARAVDTAARYGGDEFALLLPETGAEEAAQVAQRLTEKLAQSTESPGVQVSLGVAVFPDDGRTPDALIGAADRRLYQARAKVRGARLTPRP